MVQLNDNNMYQSKFFNKDSYFILLLYNHIIIYIIEKSNYISSRYLKTNQILL